MSLESNVEAFQEPETDNEVADVYTIKAVGQDEFEDVKVPDSSVPQGKAAKN